MQEEYENILPYIKVAFQDLPRDADAVYLKLLKEKENKTQTKIADDLGREDPEISMLIDELERNGFIFKRHNVDKKKRFLLINPEILFYITWNNILPQLRAPFEIFLEQTKPQREDCVRSWKLNGVGLDTDRDEKEIFDATCWRSDIVFANLLGWVSALKNELGSDPIMVLDPNLTLIENNLFITLVTESFKGLTFELVGYPNSENREKFHKFKRSVE